MSNGETYELTDASLAMYSHKNVFTSQEIQQYLELAKTILEERDCLFDEPFNRYYYLSESNKPSYSSSIKSGVLRSLILLALFADYQAKVSQLIKDILSTIQSVKDWAYISQYIESFCEAAPDAVIDCLEKSIDNRTGFLDLFDFEKYC